MTKRRNGRHTKTAKAINPYFNLTADIIIDAIMIASGQSPADDKSRTEATRWLQGETCRRWAGVIGVDIEVALAHQDCLVELE
jgi:hypothetical protein